MKLSRAWPEFSTTKSNVVDTTIGESKSDEVFPKTVVVQKVNDALQENINKIVKEIVSEEEDDPAEPVTTKRDLIKKSSKKSRKTDRKTDRKTTGHDVWIAFSVVSVLFIILLTTLFNRISFLEKIILELRSSV